ncbi:hypothetical protein HanPI659440_Chr10g0397021 [Helianthus annuus]|nr:hypothetical protein HanPI659440_Chr10g0397021 [Helianthus annuus]
MNDNGPSLLFQYICSTHNKPLRLVRNVINEQPNPIIVLSDDLDYFDLQNHFDLIDSLLLADPSKLVMEDEVRMDGEGGVNTMC